MKRCQNERCVERAFAFCIFRARIYRGGGICKAKAKQLQSNCLQLQTVCFSRFAKSKPEKQKLPKTRENSELACGEIRRDQVRSDEIGEMLERARAGNAVCGLGQTPVVSPEELHGPG